MKRKQGRLGTGFWRRSWRRRVELVNQGFEFKVSTLSGEVRTARMRYWNVKHIRLYWREIVAAVAFAFDRRNDEVELVLEGGRLQEDMFHNIHIASDGDDVLELAKKVKQSVSGHGPILQVIFRRTPVAVLGFEVSMVAVSSLHDITYDAMDALGWHDEADSVAVLCVAAADPHLKQHVLTGASDGSLRMWHLPDEYRKDLSFNDDEETSRTTCQGHAGPVYCVAIYDSGRIKWPGKWGGALSGGDDRILKLWALDYDKVPMLTCFCEFPGHEAPILCLDVDWNSRQGVTGSADKTLRLWDFTQSSSSYVFEGHSAPVLGVSLHSERAVLLSASEDRTLRFWDLQTRSCSKILIGHAAGVTCIDVDWAAGRALSGSSDCTLRLWDLAQHECIGRLPTVAPVCALKLDWSTKVALCSLENASLQQWDLVTQKVIKSSHCHRNVLCVVANCLPAPDTEV